MWLEVLRLHEPAERRDVELDVGVHLLSIDESAAGAGKTTLLRILTGLLHADGGTVTTAGFDPVDNPRGLRERVGLVPSGDRTFYLRLSGLDNLAFFARLYGFRRREAVARAIDVMFKVGLEDALKVRVGVYSHGVRQYW